MDSAVGVVAALFRYVVKSMAGERVDQMRASWHGFEGDRRYAFMRTANLSQFPFLTARDVATLLLYCPYLCDPANPINTAVRVRTPGGSDVPLESEELRVALSQMYGEAVHLMQSGRGLHDSAGISLISTATVRSIATRENAPLDPRRFRPNILIDTGGTDLSSQEDSWLDGLLVFGERSDGARIRVNCKDKRCMMVNLDPTTAVQDPTVLRAVVQSRAMCAGVYATTEYPGAVRIGDVIRLQRP